MGMLGNYIAVGEDELKRIRSGKIDIFDMNPEEHRTLDIDKSWQAVHYLLCGDIDDGEPPMGYVVPIRDENFIESGMEFGAFFADAEQVREAVEYLDSLDEDKLKGMFDFGAMLADEVYPIMDESDEDGFFWYVGRSDDVIKSSGYRIGPFEIESVIMELPYVLECGVSAAPDEVRGQVVKASVVLTKGTEPTEALKKEIQEYVKAKTENGINVVLDIEVEGAMQVRKADPSAVLVFITPPDFKTLESRLKGRGTESPEVIMKRLERAKDEIEASSKYDYIITNYDGMEYEAALDLTYIVRANALKTTNKDIRRSFYL